VSGEAKTDAGSAGTLYLVATPIGNLADLSARAAEVLGAARLVAAEDTRHTRKLLANKGIEAELISYREQNHRRAAERLLAVLEQGGDVALVSDAGMPGISDPGQALVAEAVARGFTVVPVPGPCAAVAALAGSGLPTDRFVFLGFLPRKPGAQRRVLEGLAAEPGSLVIYESPKRVGRTLAALAEVLGERRAVVVRELTKVHETFDRGSLAELAARYADGTRGEVTLVVEGAGEGRERPPASAAELTALIEALRGPGGLPASRIAALLSPLFAVDRREIYRLAAGEEP